jgi:lambda repressor-like predicted transcriptional regulator
MNKKQKEALVIALYEKGKTYREITKEAGVSPNTIKAVLNKAGLDQTTSISSRVFELYSQEKTTGGSYCTRAQSRRSTALSSRILYVVRMLRIY